MSKFMLSVLSFALTVVIYFLARKIYKRWTFVLLSPILISPIIIILLIYSTHIPYPTYYAGTKWLSYLLEPATVAFAVPLYKNLPLLKKHAVEIFSSVCLGSIIAMVSSFMIAAWLHLDPKVIDSVVPRSVTTPIAMDISHMIGGNPTITAVFVIITALVGITFGPFIIRILSFESAIAKGTLFGTGAHGIGTSKAFEIGSVEGTISSISMILAAILTLFAAPVLVPVIQHVFTGQKTYMP